MSQVRKLLLPSVNVFNAVSLDKSSRNEKHSRFDTDDETFDARHNKSADEEQSKQDRKSKKSSKRNKSEEEEEEASNEDHKSKKKKSKSNSNVDQVDTEKKEEHKQKKTPSNNNDAAAEKKQNRVSPKEEVDAVDDTETSFAEIFSRVDVSKGFSDSIEKKKRSRMQDTGLVKVIDTQENKKKKNEKNQGKSVVIDLPNEIEIGLGGESKWE